MAELTSKQEAFAQAIASGKSQADAYRLAYSAGKMADATIWSKASVLMADGKVTARVAELRAELSKKALWTREMSVKALAKLYMSEDTPPGVKVSAVRELNLMHGYNAPTELTVTTKELPASVDDFV